MTSKITAYIALALFFLSWCVPAAEGMIGIMVMLTALLYHLMIVPIPFVFPVWANLTFLLAYKHYRKSAIEPESDPIAFNYSCGTLILMLIGIMVVMRNLNFGALIWLASGIFLLFALIIQKLNEKYGKFILGGLIFITVLTGTRIYYDTLERKQYLTSSSWRQASEQTLFLKKDSDEKIPVLNKVRQNDALRQDIKDSRQSQYFDLSFWPNTKIELQFNETVHVSPRDQIKPACPLNAKQQLLVAYPITYLKDGFAWAVYFNAGRVAVGIPSALTGDYIYRARNLDVQHTQIEIIRKIDQQLIYQQVLKTYHGIQGCQYEPAQYAQELRPAFEQMLQDSDLKYGALDPWGQLKEMQLLSANCSWKQEGYNLYSFENKRIDFLDQEVLKPQFFCSKDYVAVLYFRQYTSKELESRVYMKMFERENLMPIVCGTVSFSLSQAQVDQLYQDKESIQQLAILDPVRNKECLEFEMKLNNGFSVSS